MGPRSFERGNYDEVDEVDEDELGFNGAALIRARKSAFELHYELQRFVASMGPRSFERGNSTSRRKR